MSACVFRLEQQQQGAGDAADAFTRFFGFVEQVEDAQRSDRQLQPAAAGVEQVFAGCTAVQVEGGAAGMLVALRGASQGDEGGRGLAPLGSVVRKKECATSSLPDEQSSCAALEFCTDCAQ
ncbi:hypothetical protein PA15_0313450 [Pseudomonas aeruginosa HB15]|nr:hypothetical protein PA15_0313450 [Pseudomonas aeruginosa HB15]KAJ08551.1 hypothetical protein M002_24685 [Pseudomonas aeruginosa ID4365]